MAGLSRRVFLSSSIAGLAGACASRPQSPLPPVQPVGLVSAFSGRTVGRGVFSVPLVGVERGFTAILTGVRAGNRLTVAEEFLFDDGEKNRLTWRFRQTAPGRWSGQREDVVGNAEITENGSEIRLEYEADVVSGGSTSRLQFSDVIYRRADGVLVNNAVVKKAGIPIGSIRLEFSRTAGGRRTSPHGRA